MINNPEILESLRNRLSDAVPAFVCRTGWSLRRKLFSYMLLLACLLLLVLVTGMFLLGQFNNTERETFEDLDMQMEVFEKGILKHFDSIAAAGVNLSENMTASLEGYLQLRGLSFADLTDNSECIAELQAMMLEPLLQQIRQEDCSGVFVMLDTTVNSSAKNADTSRAGVYLKVNGYTTAYNPPTLLRGDPEIIRSKDLTAHCQWKLEFDTGMFSSYEDILADALLPPVKAYRFTELFNLPGTEEDVMLLTVPMAGNDGTYYGVCGFEVSEKYFMAYHAQPTKVDHLTFLMTPLPSGTIDTAAGFSCGVSDGYYRAPQGQLTVRDAGNDLFVFDGDEIPYLGVTRKIALSPNTPDYMLSVMMRKSDFDKDMRTENIKNVSLLILLGCVAISSCHYFSRRFLTPILQSLEQLKYAESAEIPSDIPEISDLFAFLANKDREHEQALNTLEQEKNNAQSEKDTLLRKYTEVRTEYEKTQSALGQVQQERKRAQNELARLLACSRQTEIDPDAYARFLDGIKTLTATEQKIFNYYLDGMDIKQIAEVSSVKESTIYTHNRNIYSKLGINSLKQLLRYAALMRQQEKEMAELIQ